ncbi:hypothetical protein C1752_08684 [Acaryochloris thomasi RCC1774]|uniref:Uncharacterized protein n=1 Tax=Acaryochloris thomasi RCC1774 TaxID=1764569 RepID=A0A2W1J9H9_9CYAN|nr:hypothetical protein [Acaryochloris thomasi]PZD70909.1 hypothetical protein C1752_08684 [Acaryochloris thomasi RCC1774]
MINTNSSQHSEQTQTEFGSWDAPLTEPLSGSQPTDHPSPISSPPFLSPAGVPMPCVISLAGSPTVQSLMHWGLKLSPKSLHVAEWRDALALLMWQASVLRLSQMLIEDELKLKVCRKGTLRTQIQNALALLFWLGNDGVMSHA